MKYYYRAGLVRANHKNMKKISAMLLVAVVAAFSIGGVSSAKEVTSGGTGGTVTATCSPVKSLSYKGDARVGELGFASIDINYAVSPCQKDMALRVELTMVKSATGEVVYSDGSAPLSSRIAVNGVQTNTSYKVTIKVYDATTGDVVGTQSIFAAAVRKGV